jgi:hypothetical protein
MSGGGYHLQGEPADNPTTSIRRPTMPTKAAQA